MKRSEIIRSALEAAQAEGLTIEPDDDTTLLGSLLNVQSGPDPRVEQLQAQLGAMQAKERTTQATAFADAQIRARRAMPAEREALVALHVQAAEDDAREITEAGRVRVARLESLYASRPAHVLTSEQVGDAQLVALVSQSATEDGAARKQRLMRMTAVGRTALKGV